jgi:predicted XRE-type DNA-binding protein
MKLKMTRSSGNVFKDVGFPEEEAEHLRVRADLLIQIQKTIEARGLKQAEAAKLLGVTQPRVSDLVRGRLDLFSADSLIDMLGKLGVRVRLVVVLPRSVSALPEASDQACRRDSSVCDSPGRSRDGWSSPILSGDRRACWPARSHWQASCRGLVW